MVRHLPEDCAVHRAQVGSDAAWTMEYQLLAGIFDRLGYLDWHYVSVHSEKGRRPERPDPMPRPGVERPTPPRPWSPAQLARIGAKKKIWEVTDG